MFAELGLNKEKLTKIYVDNGLDGYSELDETGLARFLDENHDRIP